MSADEPDREDFEETLRSMAGELGRYIERSIDNARLDDVADSMGVDPSVARDWIESASSWLRSQTESLGEDLVQRLGQPGRTVARVDPLGGAAPHPLDLPSDEQGLALSALDSGRWTVESGRRPTVARRSSLSFRTKG